VAEANATTVVEPGWQAQVTPADQMVLERVVPRETRVALGTQADPVMLEIFNNLYMSIAEQMGLPGGLENNGVNVNLPSSYFPGTAREQVRRAAEAAGIATPCGWGPTNGCC
jgi:hypothetical protein